MKIQFMRAPIAAIGLALLLGACTTLPTPPVVPPTAIVPPPVPVSAAPALKAMSWENLPGWANEDPVPAWEAFLRSCGVLKNQQSWQEACARSATLEKPDAATLRRFFETRFTPYQVFNPDGTEEGLITGYYEPLLKGSRAPSRRYRFPVYGVPDDLLSVDLGEVHPELKGLRLRGRVQGRKVVPYYSRAEIDNGAAPLKGRELLWVDDAVDLFFLQIQGSGRVELDTGETVRLGYADQNGYPYKSIGKLLVERGELPLEKASMQGIKEWARRNPEKLTELLNRNASYVFFREMPAGLSGPLGSLGVPLTAGRSLAVDSRVIPQGAPVFLSTTWPNSPQPLNRLMLAQDTGGAIRGAVRADFFWGFGPEAETLAGGMKQPGRLWVLLPKDYALPGQ